MGDTTTVSSTQRVINLSHVLRMPSLAVTSGAALIGKNERGFRYDLREIRYVLLDNPNSNWTLTLKAWSDEIDGDLLGAKTDREKAEAKQR